MQLLYKKAPWHVDGTYKLVYMGFPVLVLGTTDVAHKFHPIAVALTSGETTEDYTVVLQKVIQSAAEITGTAHAIE